MLRNPSGIARPRAQQCWNALRPNEIGRAATLAACCARGRAHTESVRDCALPPLSQLRQNHLLDRMMRDHVARRRFVYLQPERSGPDFLEGSPHSALVLPHRLRVTHPEGLRIMLRFPKATVIRSEEHTSELQSRG